MASLAVSMQVGQQLKISPHVDRWVAIDPLDIRTQQTLVAHVVIAVVVQVQITRVVRPRDLLVRQAGPERTALDDSSAQTRVATSLTTHTQWQAGDMMVSPKSSMSIIQHERASGPMSTIRTATLPSLTSIQSNGS